MYDSRKAYYRRFLHEQRLEIEARYERKCTTISLTTSTGNHYFVAVEGMRHFFVMRHFFPLVVGKVYLYILVYIYIYISISARFEKVFTLNLKIREVSICIRI